MTRHGWGRVGICFQFVALLRDDPALGSDLKFRAVDLGTVEGTALDDQGGAFLNQTTVDYPQTTSLRNNSCGPAA